MIDVLARSGLDPAELEQALFAHGGVVWWRRTDVLADFTRWGREQARSSRCVLLRTASGELVAAASDPWDDTTWREVSRMVGIDLPVVAVSGELLGLWLNQPTVPGRPTVSTERRHEEPDSPVVQLVDRAVLVAYQQGASDVHFECDRAGITIKHRLDGVLVFFSRCDDKLIADQTISRIKVLSKLDITEHRIPQDGRFRFMSRDAHVDVRVSIMPSVHGEDAVLRLLDKAQLIRNTEQAISLEALGFEAGDVAKLRELARLPSGMLLITGPTGSGKTTTVYATLTEVQTGLEKTITIEDPVEYELPGVLQIPVNEKKGLTFAIGLRSILRHDPDRILVGEIRDGETADIAVQSSLTGHLVLSTVHANGITDIIGRFRHFGIDMFGFMSSLNGIVVQRLVRRLCQNCCIFRPSTDEEAAWLRLAHPGREFRVPEAVGCPLCHDTGYAGRLVIAEVHVIDDIFRDMATGGASVATIKAHIASRGVVPLEMRAARAVSTGATTLDEVRRVVGRTA